MQIRSDAFAKK